MDLVRAVVQLDADRWLYFQSAETVLAARTLSEVASVIAGAERLAIEDHRHVVGFVTYEAGAAFGLRVRAEALEGLPLAWFAAFRDGTVRDAAPASPDDRSPYRAGPLVPSRSRRSFGEAFDAVKAHLAQGDTYQANFTFGLSGPFDGDAEALFWDLVRQQRSRYGCFIDTPEWAICSASPELFLERRGAAVRMRPMKGTVARGLSALDDRAARDALLGSPKQRAENVMIVDMVRNDLGRVARVGSVRVPELFVPEPYPTVWQLTSTVTAETDASLADLFAAVHPCASVTGAPKRRTMGVLAGLESEPRGVYTGAVGYLAPGGDACFNVAIRTAVIDRRTRRLTFGIGSGLVWDSDADAEYAECLLKGRVLTGPRVAWTDGGFELLETLRWTPEGGFWLRGRHLARLAASAEYFGMAYDLAHVGAALDAALAAETAVRRVRLLLAADGTVRVEHRAMPETRPLRVTLAAEAIAPHDVFLYHKTTRREVYERAMVPGVDDVILWNGRGEVTESTVGNVVCEIEGVKVTPPVRCGLLPGTFREELLTEGTVKEGLVPVADLRRLGWCWVINSVHGWRRAELLGEPTKNASADGESTAIASGPPRILDRP